jgi:hypothetical protein
MIPETIRSAMSKQGPVVGRPPEELTAVQESLAELGLLEHDQVREFFEKYRLASVFSNQYTELLDLCSPTCQMADTTDFGKDTYGLTDNFVCLTSGEGEGFIIYSKSDRKVYDVSITEIEDLKKGNVEPRWDSFFDLIEWYLK